MDTQKSFFLSEASLTLDSFPNLLLKYQHRDTFCLISESKIHKKAFRYQKEKFTAKSLHHFNHAVLKSHRNLPTSSGENPLQYNLQLRKVQEKQKIQFKCWSERR